MICLLGGAVSGIVSARLLQPAGRGEMAVIQYFPSLIGAFFCLAIPSAVTLFISRCPERHGAKLRAQKRLLGIITNPHPCSPGWVEYVIVGVGEGRLS